MKKDYDLIMGYLHDFVGENCGGHEAVASALADYLQREREKASQDGFFRAYNGGSP